MRFQSATRRELVKAGGGLAAALGIVFGRLRVASAQAATPVASPGATPGATPVASPAADDPLADRYPVVRSRALAGTRAAAEVLATFRDGYVPLLRATPGFVAYLGIADEASRQTAFVTVFADKTGTDESTRRAGAWLTDNGLDVFSGDPIVVEGPIGVAAAGAAGDGATAASIAGGGVDGAYVVIRSRRLKPGRSGADLMALILRGFVPLVAAVPGFVAYLAVANETTRDQFSLGIYADSAGADESTRRAAEWGARGAADFVAGDPTVIAGTIGLTAVNEEP